MAPAKDPPERQPLGRSTDTTFAGFAEERASCLDEEQALLRLDHAREVWGDAVAPEHRGLMLAAWDSLDAGPDSERFSASSGNCCCPRTFAPMHVRWAIG